MFTSFLKGLLELRSLAPESESVKDMKAWQRVLTFEDQKVMASVYESIDADDKVALLETHKSLNSSGTNLCE